VSAPAPRSHDSTFEAATARRGKARPHLASDREAGRGSCGPAYPERESVASSDGRQRRVLPFVQTHANDHASRMSTAHTRRSRHSRVVYARNARCVPASAGGYPERLVSTTGCEGHERRWQTRCRSARASRRGRVQDQFTLAERDQPLQAGSRLAQARRTAWSSTVSP
jgi:hypothetical protein